MLNLESASEFRNSIVTNRPEHEEMLTTDVNSGDEIEFKPKQTPAQSQDLTPNIGNVASFSNNISFKKPEPTPKKDVNSIYGTSRPK